MQQLGHRLAFAFEELSPAGETGFNYDSPNHLNGTMMNHKRDTRLSEGNDEADLFWSPGRARVDQAEGIELWDPGRVGGWPL